MGIDSGSESEGVSSMGKLKYLVVLFSLAVGAGLSFAPGASASTNAPPSASWVQTSTNQIAWVHQCAAMHCGYHQIPAGQDVRALCLTTNENLEWNLIVTGSPGNRNLQIAGYVTTDALNRKETQDLCGSVGYSPVQATMGWWAHSCPSMNCGYGVIWPGEYYRPQYSFDWEGHTWTLVIDISKSPDDDFRLAGYITP
jgi:hypothetical protein